MLESQNTTENRHLCYLPERDHLPILLQGTEKGSVGSTLRFDL